MTLLGYTLAHAVMEDETNEAVENSVEIELTLYWQTHGQLERAYSTFLHVRDPDGQTIAQRDRPPVEGRYPTPLWDADEIIVDTLILSLDAVPSEKLIPVIGLYDRLTGERLPIEGTLHNELPLTPFSLQ